jgi:hypothetical protein
LIQILELIYQTVKKMNKEKIKKIKAGVKVIGKIKI